MASTQLTLFDLPLVDQKAQRAERQRVWEAFLDIDNKHKEACREIDGMHRDDPRYEEALRLRSILADRKSEYWDKLRSFAAMGIT